MSKVSLAAVTRHQLEHARAATSGRSAESLYSGHEKVLRQTVIALTAGRKLDEHESPGDATLQVLQGRIVLHAGDVSWPGRTGDLLIIPPERHWVEAVEDAVFLMTVAKRA